MPKITYEGKEVDVSNDETTEGDEITQIPIGRLFISEPDKMGKQYAFDLVELETYIINNDTLNNFYAKPSGTNFSIKDIEELQRRSPRIKKYIDDYLQKNHELYDKISEETLKQMELFLKHTGYVIRDDKFLSNIEKKYSSNELSAFEQTGVTLNDLARGEAFDQFKKYYQYLPEEEKKAIDTFPGIQKEFARYSLGNSLQNIFYLKGASCLGGTTGVCGIIVTAGKFYKQIKELFKENDERLISEFDTLVQVLKSSLPKKWRIFIGDDTNSSMLLQNDSVALAMVHLNEQINLISKTLKSGKISLEEAKDSLKNAVLYAIDESNKKQQGIIAAKIRSIFGVSSQITMVTTSLKKFLESRHFALSQTYTQKK